MYVLERRTKTETGLLLRSGDWLVLRRDDGGEWRLEASPHAERLVGQRVRLIGTRTGFDILNVETIEPC